MSKGNMLLGHARGKVGSLVFSRANGTQVVRARAEVVKNPRTESQMIQRIFLNTVAQGYSNMKSIVDHSFEGIAPGQASMSFFMQRNLDLIRQRVAEEKGKGALLSEIFEFSPLKSNFLAVNAFQIAKGTLPEVTPVFTDNADTMELPLATNTYQGVCDQYGLERGDQLTFVAITTGNLSKRSFQFIRVILDPHDSEGKEAEMSVPFITDGAIASPSDRNEGEFKSLTFGSGKITFALKGSNMMAGTIIVSRKNVDGTWARSNATLIPNDSLTEEIYDLQTCLDALEDTNIATLNRRYLNNAGTGNVESTGSGSESGGGGDGPSEEG